MDIVEIFQERTSRMGEEMGVGLKRGRTGLRCFQNSKSPAATRRMLHVLYPHIPGGGDGVVQGVGRHARTFRLPHSVNTTQPPSSLAPIIIIITTIIIIIKTRNTNKNTVNTKNIRSYFFLPTLLHIN